MKITSGKLLLTTLHRVKGLSHPLLVLHMLFVGLGVLIFAPLLGVCMRLLLLLSGKPMLADQEIAYFVLTPAGLFGSILFGAIALTLLAFEQVAMMALCSEASSENRSDILSALQFAVGRSRILFLVIVHLLLRTLVIVLPFLGLAVAIAWMTLTTYDINYYLSQHPPEFFIAAAGIGTCLLVMTILLIRKCLSWLLVLPLVLINGERAATAFTRSTELTKGHSVPLLLAFGSWALFMFLLNTMVWFPINLLADWSIPLAANSLRTLLPLLSLLSILWFVCSAVVSTWISGSFAGLLLSISEQFLSLKHQPRLAETKKPWNLTRRKLGLFVTGGALAAAGIGFTMMNSIQPRDDAAIIAHRGAAGRAPENTMAAIHAAVEDQTHWVEIDVQETKDGEVVVMHDRDFMKLAGVKLNIWDARLAEAQAIDVGSWFHPRYANERVPTLREVLQTAKGKVRVLIELKYYGHDKALEQRVVDIVEAEGMEDQIAIMSLKLDGVKKLHALRPDWRTGFLVTKSVGNMNTLDVDFLAVNRRIATRSFLRKAQSKGKDVYVWTVNEAVAISQMLSLGVNGVITDEPALVREVMQQRAELGTLERLLIHAASLSGNPVPQNKGRDESP